MEANLEKNELVELTAEIVSAYVSNNTVVATDLPGVIHNVFDALKPADRFTSDSLRGRIRRDEIGKLRLEVLQFAVKFIVFEVADCRFAFDEIRIIVLSNLRREFRVARFGFRAGHSKKANNSSQKKQQASGWEFRFFRSDIQPRQNFVIRQRLEKFAHGFFLAGQNQVGRNLAQWLQDKTTLVRARMRQNQFF